MQSHYYTNYYVSVSNYRTYFINPGHLHSVTKENNLTLQDSGRTGSDSNHEPLK